MFLLSDEERYALVDMVRYNSIDVVAQSLREKLLMRFAQAGVLALYGTEASPKPEDIEAEQVPDIDPSDSQLAITFIPLPALQEAHVNLRKNDGTCQ